MAAAAAAHDFYWSPLLEAADNGDDETVESLLEQGEDPNQRGGPFQEPAVYFAASGRSPGHFRALKALLRHGADVKYRSELEEDGRTLLHLCSSHAVPFLIQEHGLNVNERDNHGYTPLHDAALNGDTDKVAVLLDHGAATEEKNDIGSTPLACAAIESQWDNVRLLLGRDASIPNALRCLLSHVWGVARWIEEAPEDPEQNQSRSILSLRATRVSLETPLTLARALVNWIAIVGLLWYYHMVMLGTEPWEGPPPAPPYSRFLEALPSDQAFIAAHRWMIYPLVSLIDKGSGRLLKHLLKVFDAAQALEEEHHRTYNRPLLWTILESWSPAQDEWDQQDQECASEGFEILLDASPLALQVPHPENGRFPLAAALAKGLPMRVIVQMATLWPEAVALKDPVTGLPIFMLAANNHRYYSVADVHFLSRCVLPHLAVQVLRNKNNN